MSRIHRIRVVNVGHEDAYYPDLVLEFGGEDTLVCLANGGGKTTLLHHVLQVVRPGAQIDRRRIADYFGGRRRTVHVAIEFLLDEKAGALLKDDPPLLLAGVCFENRADGDGLDRLTYTCEYPRSLLDRVEGKGLIHPTDPPTLATLPLTLAVDGGRRVATLRELRQALREGGQVSVYRADQAREYEEKLRSYHIERETWEGMVRINRVEGGLKHYFETVNSVEKLVREHFLPAVLDPGEEATLREAVRQIAESAAELPRLEAEVRLCDAYLERFRALREASAAAEEARAAHEALGREAALLGARLAATEERARAAEAEARTALDAAREAEREARARHEAFAWFRLRRDLDGAEAAEAETRAALSAAEERVAAARRAVAEVEAMDLAVRSHRDLARVEAWRAERALKLRGREEVEAAWREAAGLADGALARALERAEDEARELAARKGALETEREGLLERRRALDARAAAAREGLGRLREWLRLAAAEEEALSDLLAGRPPEEALEALAAEIEAAGQDAAGAEAEAAAAEAEARARDGEASARREEAARLNARAAALEEKLAEYEAAAADLAPVLSRWGCEPALPYRERDAALRAVDEAIADRRDRLLAAQAAHARAEREVAFLAAQEAPLPAEDLLAVRAALEEAGISTELGARWLRRAPAEAREAVLGRWPFVAHGLVAESRGAWNRFVDRGAEVLASLDLRAAVPVVSPQLLDEALRAGAPEGATEGLVVLAGGAGFPLPSASAALWDPAAFEAFAAGAAERAAGAAGEVERARTSWEEAAADRERLLRFYDRFPEPRVSGWDRERGEARAAAEEARAEASRLAAAADDLRARAEAARAAAAGAHDRARRAQADRARVGAYWERFGRERPGMEAREAALAAELEGLQVERAELDRRFAEVEADLARLGEAQASLAHRVADLRRERADLAAPETREPPDGADLAELLARARAAREAFHGRAREVGEIDERIREALARVEERRETIRGLGVEEPPAERVAAEAARWDPVARRRDAREGLRAAEGALAGAREAHEAARAKAQALRDRLGRLAGEFRGRHGVEVEETLDPAWDALARAEEAGTQRTLTAAVARAGRSVALAQAAWEAADGFRARAAEAAARARGLGPGAWEGEAEPLDPDEIEAAVDALPALLERWREAGEARDRAVRRRERALAAFLEFLRTEAVRLAGRLDLAAEDAERALATHAGVERYWGLHAPAVEDLRRSALAEKERLEAEKTEVAGRCAAFARRLAEEIRSIQRYSTVRFAGGGTRRLLQVDLALRDEAAAEAEMRGFVQRFVEAYAQAPEADRASLAVRSVTGFELLRVVARLDRARVRIYKPKTPGAPARYSDWEEVRAWSGGEKQVACYLLFVATLTYATYRAAGREDATKVLLLDNPVGEASSAHLLRVMVELARENAIQLIVLTAHQDPGIWKYFRNLVSLVPVPTSRRTYVQLDRDTMEAFRAHFAVEEATLLAAPNRDWAEDFAPEEGEVGEA
ncbi:hypothetical protein [Deferrisoma palaeochoriense]